jgi:MFS family permease
MSDRPDSTQQPSLWRHGAFMKLWVGQSISQLGSQVTILALPLTAILLFRATPFQVGLLGTFEFLPFVLLGLPVGVWVDRVRRKPLLVAADLGRFLVLGSVPLAYGLDELHIGHLYAAAFLSGVFTVFFDVAYGSYLPSLIDRGRLVDGNSKLEISRSGAQLLGPGLGGILVQAFTAPVAILADAGSYLGSVLFLFMIRRKEPPVEGPAEGSARMAGQIREGLRYVLRHRLLRPLLACTATLNFTGGITLAVLLLFAVRSLDMSPGVIGIVLALGNVGLLGGAFVAGRISRRLGVGPTLIGAGALIGFAWALLPLASPSTAVPLLIVYGVLWSFGAVIYNVNGRSLVQSITPDRLLGRTVATNRFVVWGTIPLGTFLGGILGSRIGLRPTLWISAAGGLVAFLPPLLSEVRRLTDMPTLGDVETSPPLSIAPAGAPGDPVHPPGPTG